jgi:RimJ/RimL family protein N-acetyltransferase
MRPSSYRFPDELHIDDLIIRYPTASDLETIAPAFVDPEVGGEAGLPPVGPEMLVAALETEIPRMRENGLLCPYVIEGADVALLGGLALHHFDSMRDALEVGYWLLREARGHGVATRSVRAAIDHAFANGIFRMEAHVRVGNTASERVLERLGFEREGVKRRYLRHGDERVDATLFSLLASDYDSSSDSGFFGVPYQSTKLER